MVMDSFCVSSLSLLHLLLIDILERFETVEAAERCITSLRRYRNLHPTFSKVSFFLSLPTNIGPHSHQQIHKIPGTPYSQMDQDSTFTSDEWDVETHQSGEASFKARLESLHDPTSTNLYIEGYVQAIFLNAPI